MMKVKATALQQPFSALFKNVAQNNTLVNGERGGLVVNASDSGSRGRGFEPHLGQTVLCP